MFCVTTLLICLHCLRNSTKVVRYMGICSVVQHLLLVCVQNMFAKIAEQVVMRSSTHGKSFNLFHLQCHICSQNVSKITHQNSCQKLLSRSKQLFLHHFEEQVIKNGKTCC